jgi:RimJ/RimL family protein N-acetyltransferase
MSATFSDVLSVQCVEPGEMQDFIAFTEYWMVADSRLQAFRENPQPTTLSNQLYWERAFHSTEDVFFAAKIEGQFAGVIEFKAVVFKPDYKIFELSYWLAPPWQGQGLGSSLLIGGLDRLKECFDGFKEECFVGVLAKVLKTNEPSRRILTKHVRFQLVGENAMHSYYFRLASWSVGKKQ